MINTKAVLTIPADVRSRTPTFRRTGRANFGLRHMDVLRSSLINTFLAPEHSLSAGTVFDTQDVLASVLAHGCAECNRSSLLNAFLRGLQTRAFPQESRIFRSLIHPCACSGIFF